MSRRPVATGRSRTGPSGDSIRRVAPGRALPCAGEANSLQPGPVRLGALLCATLMGSALVSAAGPVRGSARSMPPALAQFLRQTVALDSGQIIAVSGGEAVVKALAPADHREIAVFGIVRIAVPRSFYVDRATDFPSALTAPSRLRSGLFSDPAVESDVAAFSLPDDDVRDLTECRVGSCNVKLPIAAMRYLHAHVDPASPSADSIASAYFRARLVDYVSAYRARGDSALIAYDDQRPSAAAAQVFAGMLSRSPYMYQYAPSLERYLENYPGDRPVGARDVFYWSEDDLPGLKPTLTITHEVVYAPPELPGSTLIASKLLYADHYLDGALDLTAVVDQPADSAGEPGGVYVLLLHRLHFDNLPSGGLINVRGKVVAKLSDRTRTALRDAKMQSEQAYLRTLH